MSKESEQREQKSPEYVPPGPVTLARMVPRAVTAVAAPPPQVLVEAVKQMTPEERSAFVACATPAPAAILTAESSAYAPPPGWVRPEPTTPLGPNDTHDTENDVADDVANEPSLEQEVDRLEGAVDALAEEVDKFSAENVRGLIVQECRAIEEMLVEKNKKYGNSVVQPLQIFARDISPEAQVRVRIDDKLKRIANGLGYEPDEDTVEDLIGYLILHRVQKRLGM